MILANYKRLLLGVALLLYGVILFFYGMTDDDSKAVDTWYVIVRFIFLGAAFGSAMTDRSKSMRTLDNVALFSASVLGGIGFFATILLLPDYNYGSSVLLVYTVPLILISLVWIVGSFEKKQPV